MFWSYLWGEWSLVRDPTDERNEKPCTNHPQNHKVYETLNQTTFHSEANSFILSIFLSPPLSLSIYLVLILWYSSLARSYGQRARVCIDTRSKGQWHGPWSGHDMWNDYSCTHHHKYFFWSHPNYSKENTLTTMHPQCIYWNEPCTCIVTDKWTMMQL